jgi:hypothetical protein
LILSITILKETLMLNPLLAIFISILLFSNAKAANLINSSNNNTIIDDINVTTQLTTDKTLVVSPYQTLTIKQGGLLSIVLNTAVKSTPASEQAQKPPTPQTPKYTIQGERRVYDRPVYGTKGNLAVNSNFSSGTTGWKFTDLADSKGNPLYTVVKHGGKSWMRINQEIQTSNRKQGLLEQTITIPAGLRDTTIEVSFLVSGMVTGFRISGDGPDIVFDAKIASANPERVYYYYHPKGASSFTISFMKGYPGQSTPGEYFDITEIAVREATWTQQIIGKGLPASGGTLQLARWLVAWDEKSQHKQLDNIKKLGGMARVWLSAELFGTYITKKNPTKRKSPNLTSQYRKASVAKVFTSLDPEKIKQLDWFFEASRQHGLKVIVTLFGGFTDGVGNPHNKLSVPQSMELLDTDADVRTGFNTLTTAIVSRYASYDNIVAWEFVNEGWATWRAAYSGYSTQASFSADRSLSFSGYRSWERSAYSVIKAADPKKRPVMLNSGDQHYLLHSDDVCDWNGISLYLGSIKIANYTGTPSRFIVFTGKTNSLANGTPLKAYTTGSFPSGLTSSKTYYVVNVSPVGFEVAITPGGAGVSVSGGSGTLYFYSTDGTSLAAFDNVFQRWADLPKPTVLAEMGAPTDVGLLYRDDNYEAAYLREGYKKLKKYGFVTGIVFDEFPGNNILWDSDFNLNNSGKIVEKFGISGKVD